MASSGWVVYHESAFKGKVIDAETKEPIEGAVVVAIYSVWIRGLLEMGSDIADVQETLTDSNGEYHIPGNIFFFFWPFTLGGTETDFIIFKAGYGDYSGKYSFLIYPVKETFGTPKREREGIVYKRIITNKEERELYEKKFGSNMSPFIPLKDPFEKVRNLDIPFDADIFNAEQIWTSDSEPFKTYPLIGLPKLKTREERIKVNVSPVGEKSDWRKQKEFIKAIREEWQSLYREDPRNLYKWEE